MFKNQNWDQAMADPDLEEVQSRVRLQRCKVRYTRERIIKRRPTREEK